MAIEWVTQADKATELLYDAEELSSYLIGGMDGFMKLDRMEQSRHLAKLHACLSDGRDHVHAMVLSFYEIHKEHKT